MPLIKSPSKKAVGKNIAAEIRAGKPQKQSIAIAMDVQRRSKGKKKMAGGGPVVDPDKARQESAGFEGSNSKKARPSTAPAEDTRSPWEQAADPGEGDSVVVNPSHARGGMIKAYSKGGMAYPDSTSRDATDMMHDSEANGNVAISAKSERRPMPSDITHEEMEMLMNHRASKQPVSSWTDHKDHDADDQNSHLEEAGRHSYADGGKVSDKPVSGWADERDSLDSPEDDYDSEEKSFQSISRSPVEGWTDQEDTADHEDHPMSIAESIMKRKGYAQGGPIDGNKKSFYPGLTSKKKFASGGEVDDLEPFEIEGHETPEDGQADVARNAREDQNHEDDQSFNALRKENYSENEGLSKMGSPEDSNEEGDESEKNAEDEHDMVGKIRKGMKMRKVGQRYSEK